MAFLLRQALPVAEDAGRPARGGAGAAHAADGGGRGGAALRRAACRKGHSGLSGAREPVGESVLPGRASVLPLTTDDWL